ncbi:MAG: thioether cross-link-forming SCIFF peptide maturase [Peptostreptococcales bacterium]|jgi:uncharacterized protein
MIHKYKFKDKYIVLDVNSGSVHVVDKIIYDILDYYDDNHSDLDYGILYGLLNQEYSPESIKEALEEIQYLEGEKLLFADDDFITEDLLSKKEPVVKALCLHVAHDCNMKCKYCFASQGSFQGTKELMSLEIGKKAIDFLIEQSGNRRNLEVDFFGGEPLLNFDVVKELVAYGRETEKKKGKNIRFTITTNGIALDEEKIEYINENMENVILSIDGRPEINDYMRTTLNDKGTFNLIIDNYQKFIEKRTKKLYYVRGTFTKNNLDFSKDVLFLTEQGFKNVSVEPVVVSEDVDYRLTEEDLPTIFGEYDKLADFYIQQGRENKDYEFFHFNLDLNQGPCVIKRVSGCGAGTEYMAIAPNGDLYPCHQFVGVEEFKIGNLLDENLDNPLYDTFNSAHIYTKEKCKSCWAKFYCSGGCHASAYNMNQDIHEPYFMACEMERKRIECAIGIKAVLD